MLRIFVFFMAFSAALAFGKALEAPLSNYTISEIVWEIDAFNNGTMVNLTGTIEEVHDQLIKINPDYATAAFVNREKHGNPGFNTVACGADGHSWEGASRNRIENGIQYLHGVFGKPAQGPGPGSCGRVSCSYKSAIWWCNDNPTYYELPSFDVIADAADNIVYWCSYTVDGKDYVVGQNFDDNNWNAIVRHDEDHC